MYYCVSVMMLGYTRTNGVVAYDNSSRGFEEITPALAKQLISRGLLKGIKWKNNEERGEFICDTKGWNQQNIPIKTACGKFRPMLNDIPGVPINSMYTVVRVIDTDYRGRLYEVVSNKCVRIKIEEKNLRELNKISSVAGVWISDDEITWIDGVDYEDRRAEAKKPTENVEGAGSGDEGTKPSEEEPEGEGAKLGEEEPEGEETDGETDEETDEKSVSAMDKLFEEPQSMEDVFGSDGKADGFMEMPDQGDMMPPIFGDTASEEPKDKKTTSKRKRK